MNNWNVNLVFFFPHERFLIGWNYLKPDDDADYYSFIISLGFISIDINYD